MNATVRNATVLDRLADSHGIAVAARRRLGDRLVEVELTSRELDGPAGVRILLPDGYDPDRTDGYPVLYLLHGGLGGYRDWTDHGGVEDATVGCDLIVVMPSGGTGGWYRDWHNFGSGGRPRWEAFHIGQLIPWVDRHLATRAGRSGRGIAGLSMGGRGALAYAARHPGRFCAAVSFSGAVDTRFPLVRALIGVSPLAHRRPPFAIDGFPLIDEADQRAHNPWDLAEALRGMHVTITCGNGRPTRRRHPGDTRPKDLQEHRVRAMTLSLHERLDELGIDHRFDDRGDVGHTFDNWRPAFADELPRLCAALGITPRTVT